jgi:hypothetical protein
VYPVLVHIHSDTKKPPSQYPAGLIPGNTAVIEKDQLVMMFEQIADNTDWDLSAPLIWGFFFTDASAEKLRAVAPVLEQDGYRFVDVFLADKEEPADPDLWMLHVEKIEIHTPDSLDARNGELYRFAAEHSLGAYDGMDVAPVNPEED